MSSELRKLFKNDELDIVSRNSPNDRPAGYTNEKDMPLTHDRATPLISIVFDLEPVTEDILKLYRVNKAQVKLEDNSIENNRDNFKKFFKHNYKKYLYKATRDTNDYMHTSTKAMIE